MTTDLKSIEYPTTSGKKNDLLPELTIEMVPLSKLRPAKHSVRKKSNRQIAKGKASILQFGVSSAALITDDGEIVDGHSMIEGARQVGLKEYPCIRINHLADHEVRGLRIAINKIQESGEWDEGALKLELIYQLEFNTDLTSLGFEPPELDDLFEISTQPVEVTDPADDLETHVLSNEPVVTRDGDIWQLGGHFIACGNARTSGLIGSLLDSCAADLVFTDPPFNVPINGHVRVDKGTFAEFAEAYGEKSPSEYTQFLLSSLNIASANLKSGGLLYCFMDWRHMRELQDAIRDAGLQHINLCVWVKTNGGMGSFYRSRQELVFVTKKPGAPHTNNIQLGSNGRYRTNVWEYAGATGGKSDEADDFGLHPTVKPIRLVEDALLDASAVGETVLDPFLGSGTTLLAAERTKRRCVGIEISPAYVDVTIHRWQQMTGRDAVLQSSGETFSACAEMRCSETELAGTEAASCAPASDAQEDF